MSRSATRGPSTIERMSSSRSELSGTSLWYRLTAVPVDVASIAAFRIGFGLLMCVGLVRFMAQGWVEKLYVEPTYFFKFPGFFWVPVWEPLGLYLHLGGLAVLAALVALGLFYRVAIVGFTLGFTCLQLLDVTNYLNHYVLVVWLGVLLSIIPAHGAWSLDARLRPSVQRSTVPAWMLNILRFQVAVVYFNAGLAKLGSDWLLHAQPLTIWLRARTELPLLGPLFEVPLTAYVMSWAGFLYDLTIAGWLLYRPTRPWAYLAVLAFHGVTWALFDIGMFPFIMAISSTLMFSPSWPRRFLGHRPTFAMPAGPRPLPAWGTLAVGAFVLFHVLVPLRHWAYPGNVLWNEAGMRFAWKVMVREKNGSITYHVTHPPSGKRWVVSPHDYLTWRQANEMSSQPDLIHQLARHIAGDFARLGYQDVEVRAEAWVSLNGRRRALMIDPSVNLAAHEPRWGAPSWVTAGPTEPPPSSPVRISWRGRVAP